jgi:hypothetical protein
MSLDVVLPVDMVDMAGALVSPLMSAPRLLDFLRIRAMLLSSQISQLSRIFLPNAVTSCVLESGYFPNPFSRRSYPATVAEESLRDREKADGGDAVRKCERRL